MRAGPPAVCIGQVHHRRSAPAEHAFTNRVRYVWLDPDRPDELTGHHWAWSAERPALLRFRASDYGRPSGSSLGDDVRDDLTEVLGHRPRGEVRMLTQLRHLGWLFNPITVFLAWDADPQQPVGAVLEVTNTPWNERHRYPVALEAGDDRFVARFAKELHVSPFLDEAFDYALAIDDRDDRLVITLDAVAPGNTDATVSTRLDVGRSPASRTTLAAGLRSVPFSTHRVSAGIHAQALALWRKRVPFVSHPSKRQATDHRRIGDFPIDAKPPTEAPR